MKTTPANIRLIPYEEGCPVFGGLRLAASPSLDFIIPFIFPPAAAGAEGALQAKEAELTLFSGREGHTQELQSECTQSGVKRPL